MTKSYPYPLTATVSAPEDWFEQYTWFLKSQKSYPVEPEPLVENPNEAQRTAHAQLLAEYNQLCQTIKPHFLTSIDPEIFSLLTSLASPNDVNELTYFEMKTILINHMVPKPTVLAERFRFYKCHQKQSEKTADFVARLKKLAVKCKFTDFGSSMLDQFIMGIVNSEAQELLLEEDFEQLTLERAYRKVVAMDRSKSEAAMIKNSQQTVHKVQISKKSQGKSSQGSSNQETRCNKCKLKSHATKDCYTKCFNCGELYHTAKDCRKKTKRKSWKQSGKSTHHVSTDCNNSDSNSDSNQDTEQFVSRNIYYCELSEKSVSLDDQLNVLFQKSSNLGNNLTSIDDSKIQDDDNSVLYGSNLHDDSHVDLHDNNIILHDNRFLHDNTVYFDNVNFLRDSRPLIKVWINRRECLMEFDSGSSVSVCSREMLKKAGVEFKLRSSDRQLRVANGQYQQVCGKAVVEVAINNQIVKGLELYVVDNHFPALFGRSWITEFCGENWLEKLVTRTQGQTAEVGQRPTKEVELERTDGNCSAHEGEFPGTQEGVRTVNVLGVMESEPVTDTAKRKFKTGQRCEDEETAPGTHQLRNFVSVDDETDPGTPTKIRTVQEIMSSDIFKDELGLVKNYKVQLQLKEGSRPVTQKSRAVPFAIKDLLEKELDNMVKQGILKKVKESPWGTPVMPVKKGDGVRICGDFKAVNKLLEMKHHPLPTTEECFASVSGGEKFSVIDIKQAYNNVELSTEDQLITTMNTHMGQYVWTRLPYGINSSAAIFQNLMDNVLRGIPMVCCRIDDILISGKNDKEHLDNLNKVVRRLEANGFRCRLNKSKLMHEEVIYLGHKVNKHGMSPVNSKIDDLLKVPAPENVKNLVAFLGAVGYYRKYLPDLSTIIAPLDELRKTEVEWRWTKTEQKAFEELKKLLCSDRVLTFYNPLKRLKLDTDASSVGLGAVLSHIDDDGTNERPVEFISRTLSNAEKKYSQIDKEALGIVWAIKRFHMYLYGRHFELVTDHQPLVHIFGPKRGIPEMTANRLSRYALLLQNYDYNIVYRNTKEHANADVMSRFPKKVIHVDEPNECEEAFSLTMEDALIDAKEVARETSKDIILSKIAMYIVDGWPEKIDKDHKEMKAMYDRKNQLTTEKRCITWGNRVIIPHKLRAEVLKMLHLTHVGMTGMKSLARSYVWWPGIDQDIEILVKACASCQKHGKKLPKVIDHPWVKSTRPWQRVHVDFAGEFQNNYWLLMYDTYSKWPEVIKMSHNTTAPATIKAMRRVFSRTGVPWVLVSDNGPQFISEEFKNFLKKNQIRHVLCPSYSPRSNGSCERFVQSFKSAMKKMYEKSKDLDLNLANFLMAYRNTPHSVTKQPPAVMMYGRTLRSKLHHLRPSDQMEAERLDVDNEQKVVDSKRNERVFEEKQTIWVRPDTRKEYEPATIEKRHGKSLWYDVNYKGRIIKKHVDAMKKRLVPVIELQKQQIEIPERNTEPRNIEQPVITVQQQPGPSREGAPAVTSNQPTQSSTQISGQEPVRRSGRLSAKPQIRYNANTGFVNP